MARRTRPEPKAVFFARLVSEIDRWERYAGNEKWTRQEEAALAVARVALAYLGGRIYVDRGRWTSDPKTGRSLMAAWRVLRGRDKGKTVIADDLEERIGLLEYAVSVSFSDVTNMEPAIDDVELALLHRKPFGAPSIDREAIKEILMKTRPRGTRSARGPVAVIIKELLLLINVNVEVNRVSNILAR